MADRDNIRELRTDLSQQIVELKKIAYMYHAVGNYAKADEVMSLVYEMERPRRQQRQESPRRDAA